MYGEPISSLLAPAGWEVKRPWGPTWPKACIINFLSPCVTAFQVLRQMRKELRHKLERDVKEFQDNLQRDEDSAYFRQLEADRLRGKFQLATRSAFY